MKPSSLLFCIGALGLFIISCSPQKDFSSERLSDKVRLTVADWSNMEATADLGSEAIHSWLPERGIRGRYQIAKSVLSKTVIESIVGEKAFVSGPHTNEIDYTSPTTFGHYNPKFLAKLKTVLGNLFNNKILVSNAQGLYDSQLKQYLRTYYLAYKVGANNKPVMAGYLSAVSHEIASPSADPFLNGPSYFLQESFRDFAESSEKEGYDVYEAFTCPGFWVRRSIDGTADEFYALLKLTIQTFDADFLTVY